MKIQTKDFFCAGTKNKENVLEVGKFDWKAA